VAPTTLSLRQAVKAMGVSYKRALEEVHAGRLPATREGWVWLVTTADLARWIEDRRIVPQQRQPRVGERGVPRPVRIGPKHVSLHPVTRGELAASADSPSPAEQPSP
jgi:hypothetical protein